MVQQAQQLLPALLRAGMFNKLQGVVNLLPAAPDCWKLVFRLARTQTVTGLVYQGICRLPNHLLPPPALLMQWVAQVEVIERHNHQTNQALQELTACFVAQGLNPIVLKGQALAALYPEPLLRECGDIDLCFDSTHESQAALRALQTMGYQPQPSADGSYHFRWQGIDIELHQHFTDAASPRLRRELQRLAAQFPPINASQLTGVKGLRTPAPLPNLLLLNLHLLKHALGRGIGLRQFADLAVASVHYCEHISLQQLRQAHHALGIERWSHLLYTLLQQHLGLPDTCNPYAHEPLPSTQALLQRVLREGNFGRKSTSSHAPQPQPVWKRKLATAQAFAGRAGFALRYAPTEAFYTFTQLLFGQHRS